MTLMSLARSPLAAFLRQTEELNKSLAQMMEVGTRLGRVVEMQRSIERAALGFMPRDLFADLNREMTPLCEEPEVERWELVRPRFRVRGFTG